MAHRGIAVLGVVLAFACGSSKKNNIDGAPSPIDATAADAPPPPIDAMPPDAAPPNGGTVAFGDLAGTVVIGGTPTAVRILRPIISLPVSPVTHDFDSQTATGGCIGDHYDVAAGDVPPTDGDGGVLSFTGYTGGMLLSGSAAPPTIDCAIPAGSTHYRCGYGSGMGPDPSTAPFPSSATPIALGDMITIMGAGGAAYQAFSGMPAPGGDMTLMEDLTTITYDPTTDTVLHPVCTGGTCTANPVMIAIIDVSPNPPSTFDAPAPTSGRIICLGLALGASPTITIKKEAIAAAFAGDTSLHTVRTVVLRSNLPQNVMDPAGNKVGLVSGHGQFDYSTF
jgi:hypothetical protein